MEMGVVVGVAYSRRAMASQRVLRQAAEAVREPVDAVVLGVHRSRWFLPVLIGTATLVFLVVLAVDLGVIGFVIGFLVVVIAASLNQRQVYLVRTPTRLALVRAPRAGVRPSRMHRVVERNEITVGPAGPGMQGFTIDGTTYLVSRLYTDELDEVLAR